MLARDYYLSLVDALTSFPFTVEVRLVFDEVLEQVCHIHGSVTFERSVVLYISEYTRTSPVPQRMKYRYHLQTMEGEFLARWDNAPHHKLISTYPHHQHLPGDNVVASAVTGLLNLLPLVSFYFPD